MENISLVELQDLIKEIKQDTEAFTSRVKASVFLGKNGDIINPQELYIMHHAEGLEDKLGHYSLVIDDYNYRLIDKVPKLSNEQGSAEASQFLKANNAVITDVLEELEESPKYFAISSDDPNYMDLDYLGEDGIIIKSTIDKITVISPRMSFNYDLKKGDFTIGNDTSFEDLARVLARLKNVEQILDNCKALYSSLKVDVDSLPVIIKNKYLSKTEKKLIKEI